MPKSPVPSHIIKVFTDYYHASSSAARTFGLAIDALATPEPHRRTPPCELSRSQWVPFLAELQARTGVGKGTIDLARNLAKLQLQLHRKTVGKKSLAAIFTDFSEAAGERIQQANAVNHTVCLAQLVKLSKVAPDAVEATHWNVMGSTSRKTKSELSAVDMLAGCRRFRGQGERCQAHLRKLLGEGDLAIVRAVTTRMEKTLTQGRSSPGHSR